MEQVIKVAGIAIVATFAALAVKRDNPSGALLIAVAAGVVALVIFLSILSPIIRLIEDLADDAGLSPAVISPLIKTLGISIITKISSDACSDAKEELLSTCVELTGAAAALYVALPLLSAVLSLTKSYLSS